METARVLVGLLPQQLVNGLTIGAVYALIALIWPIRDLGVTVGLVARATTLVTQVSENVAALDHGETIVEGPPAAIQWDRREIEGHRGKAD